ncbi:MAG: hypothetical protein ACRCTA_07805 [Bacilli bacterium]
MTTIADYQITPLYRDKKVYVTFDQYHQDHLRVVEVDGIKNYVDSFTFKMIASKKHKISAYYEINGEIFNRKDFCYIDEAFTNECD